jgi:hypothetical protein
VEEDRFVAEVERVLKERRREALWAISPVDHPAQPWEDHIMRAGPLRSSRTQKGPTDDTPQPVLCRR